MFTLIIILAITATTIASSLTDSPPHCLDHIPTIDVSSVLLDSPTPAVLSALEQACTQWGFFQITNHGLNLSSLQLQIERFFALPQQAKRQVKRHRDNSRGWANDELTKQKVDLKEIFDFGHVPRPEAPDASPVNRVLDGFNQWPAELGNGFRLDLTAYYHAASVLSFKLFRALAQAVKLPLAQAEPCVTSHTSFMRLNFYPDLGISRHTDAGMLTLLWQQDGIEPPSLQVYTGSKEDARDGTWVGVRPEPGALTVNIGDMFHVMTGGTCPAPEHRVLANKQQARTSAAFFYNPDYACNVQVLVPQSPQKYRPINWGQFRAKRFQGDYEDVGEENQIEHYEI